MSKSTADRHPRSGRYLRLPDAVFHASAPPERRAPAAVLERAIGGTGRPARGPAGAPPARKPLAGAPPARQRVFSGELRDVTGSVIRHGSPEARAKSDDRLAPPPAREKPWLRQPEARLRKSPSARPAAGEQERPWLRGSRAEADTAAEHLPARADGAEPTEYVLIEDLEFRSLAEERQLASLAGADWIVVGDEVETAAQPGSSSEMASETAAMATAAVASGVSESEAAPAAMGETVSGELIIESDSDVPVDAAQIAEPEPVSENVPAAHPETKVEVEAEAAPVVPAVADAATEVSEIAEAAAVPAGEAIHPDDELVEYLEDEPLFMDAQPEPFIQLPDFPQTPAVFDVPAELEPEHVATPPAEDEPEHIVELPEDSLDPNRNHYVPGIILEYDVEYVDEGDAHGVFAYSAGMADPLAPSPESAPPSNQMNRPAAEAVSELPVESEPLVEAMPVVEAAPESASEADRKANTEADAEVAPVNEAEPEAKSEPEAQDAAAPAAAEVVTAVVSAGAAGAVVAATAPEPTAKAAQQPDETIEVKTRPATTAASLNELSDGDELDDGDDSESLKRELFHDIRRELQTDFAAESMDPELDLDLSEELDAQIEAGFDDGSAGAGAAKTEAETPSAVAAAPELMDMDADSAGEADAAAASEVVSEATPEAIADDELLLADDELLAHLSIEAPAVPEFEALSSEDASALRLRLEQAWSGSAVPAAVSAAGLAETLQRIYTGERPTTEHFSGILQVLLEKTRADALGFLMLDTQQMVYRPLLSAGLDARTAGNFYLSVTDVQPEEHPDFELRRRDAGELVEWQKRFSSAAFQDVQGVYLIPVHRLGLPAYLALIYSDLERATEHVLTSMLPPILRELVPALHRFAMVQWRGAETERVGMQRTEDTSIVDHIYRLLGEVSNGGRESIEVLHLHFPALLQENTWRLRLDRMAAAFLDHMTANERLVEATPERITLILKQTSSAEMLRIAGAEAEANGLALKSRALRFPEHSRNLYNYISPGL